MTVRGRWARRVVPVLWFASLAFLTIDPLVREVFIDAHNATVDATVTGYDDNARYRVLGEAGTIDVHYEPANREATSTVTQYGFADLPRRGAIIRIDYDIDHPSRARRAGDHGDAVAGMLRLVVWVAGTAVLFRWWRDAWRTAGSVP